ncbi:MAG: sigma-70 family RNA polymerase sigma factor [Planctomycetota bacterium]
MSTTKSQPTRRASSPTSRSNRTSTAKAASKKPAQQVVSRARRLLDTEIDFIPNDDFVGRRDSRDDMTDFVAAIELNEAPAEHELSNGLPSHLGRLCATPLLTAEQEQELFRRMNFCKYRANALRSRLSRTRPDVAKLREAEEYLQRAERLRNYLIQANTRLVMSIARKFADGRNGFDDLLSHGIGSLMHTVEKFDYARGYRFSTYATCAVRRDLYRLVMSRKKDFQRFTTGSDEFIGGCADEVDRSDEMTESAWNHLTDSIGQMLERLDERERFIVTYRFGLDESGKKSSYSRLGERLGISKERVRQLANRALDKLREWAPEHRLEALLA